ncbi:MAG: hypothetical protein M3434_09935 [Gemmatimonadota bacterium]|nr:hypothetical protein [Gemmatimonadota bacterium]
MSTTNHLWVAGTLDAALQSGKAALQLGNACFTQAGYRIQHRLDREAGSECQRENQQNRACHPNGNDRGKIDMKQIHLTPPEACMGKEQTQPG